jgi:hypothetical protein
MFVRTVHTYLGHALRQSIRGMAYKHSMATCRRPGGGMCGRELNDAIEAQIVANDEIIRNARDGRSNPRAMHAHQLVIGAEQQGVGSASGSVNFKRE